MIFRVQQDLSGYFPDDDAVIAKKRRKRIKLTVAFASAAAAVGIAAIYFLSPTIPQKQEAVPAPEM